MLELLRKKQKPVMLIALIFVGIPFIGFFGIDDQVTTDNRSVGEAFGESIPALELYNQGKVLSQVFFRGRNLDVKIVESQARLVIVYSRMAERQGVQMSDSAVRDFIVNMLGAKDQKTLMSNYETWLRGMQITKYDFEQSVRRVLLYLKFNDIMNGFVHVTTSEINKEFKRKHEKVDLSYVEINSDDYANGLTANDEDVQKYYTANKTKYEKEEEVQVEYLMAEYKQFRSKVAKDDKTLKAHYDKIKTYRFVDRTVKKKDEKDPDTYKPFDKVKKEVEEDYVRSQGQDLARKAIDTVQASLDDEKKASVAWASLAKEHGVTAGKTELFPISKTSTQVFGSTWINPNMATNEASAPIYATNGYIIYRILDKKGRTIPPLAEVKAQVSKDIIVDKAKEAAVAKLDGFRVKVLNGEFEKFAKEDKFEVKTQKGATRQSFPLLAQLDQIAEGEVSDVIMDPRTPDPGEKVQYFIFNIVKRSEPDYSKITKEEKEQIKNRVLSMKKTKFDKAFRNDIDDLAGLLSGVQK